MKRERRMSTVEYGWMMMEGTGRTVKWEESVSVPVMEIVNKL